MKLYYIKEIYDKYWYKEMVFLVIRSERYSTGMIVSAPTIVRKHVLRNSENRAIIRRELKKKSDEIHNRKLIGE